MVPPLSPRQRPACSQSRIRPALWTAEYLAAAAAERALAIALVCARDLGQYRWEAALAHRAHHGRDDLGPVPSRDVGRYACHQPVPVSRATRGPGAAVIIITSSEPQAWPGRPPGATIMAAVDVEWSKNYRVPNGNVPFCYSVIWLSVPASSRRRSLDRPVSATRRYTWRTLRKLKTCQPAPTGPFAMSSAPAGLIAGHQLCSDLAVLANTATARRTPWRRCARPGGSGGRPPDPSHRSSTPATTSATCSAASAAASSTCAATCCLDVTQPELRGTSMTALHRRWLQAGDVQAREKISVLNLRHSLSTALAALYAAGIGRWDARSTSTRCWPPAWAMPSPGPPDPTFTALLEDRP